MKMVPLLCAFINVPFFFIPVTSSLSYWVHGFNFLSCGICLGLFIAMLME